MLHNFDPKTAQIDREPIAAFVRELARFVGLARR